MAAGTGDISASMDYGEVSGQNARVVQKKTVANVGSSNFTPMPSGNNSGLSDKQSQAQLVYQQQMQVF